MKIITVANRKGGTGKTATAHALGIGLKNEGYSVLFIDMDSQENLSHAVGLPVNNETNKNIYSVIIGEININDAIEKTDQADIIRGDGRLAYIESILTETGKEYKLKEAIENIKNNYDYIVIDTGAQLGIITINALTASNEVLIPVNADIYSIRGLGLLNETITTIRKYTNPSLKIGGILLTRYNKRSKLAQGVKEGFIIASKEINAPLLDTYIRECVAIKEAQFLQKDIYSYAPKSNATEDYKNFIKEYLSINAMLN